MRGTSAEYLVGCALGCVNGQTRREWDTDDLPTAGPRVEVKTSTYGRATAVGRVAVSMRQAAVHATRILAAEVARQCGSTVDAVWAGWF